MRLLLEVLVLAAVIALGWEKSFHQSLGEVPFVGQYIAPAQPEGATASTHPPRAEPAAAVATATPTGAWMWDPKHKSALDRPSPSASPTPPTSFTGHIYYTDENGKKYWIDGQGKRHYD